MNKKEELVVELIKANALCKQLQEQIAKIDYDENFAKAHQYVGKFYMEVNEHHPEFIDCIFVYGVNTKNCELDTIRIHYCEGQDTYFGIEHYTIYEINREEDDCGRERKEISKEKFEKHYSEVLKRIKIAMPS